MCCERNPTQAGEAHGSEPMAHSKTPLHHTNKTTCFLSESWYMKEEKKTALAAIIAVCEMKQ